MVVMTTVHLIRHGAVDRSFGPGDAPLSQKGRQQAQRLAPRLADIGCRHVYASPLARARQTAEILAERLNLPLTVDPLLRERMNWGDVPGQSFVEFVQLWKRCTDDPAYEPYPGVSVKAAAERLARFLAMVRERHPGATVAAVSHGGIMTDFLRANFDFETLARLDSGIARGQDPENANCSITTLTVTPSGCRVEALAVKDHLSCETTL